VNANDADGLIGLTCSDLELIPPQEHPVSGTDAQQMIRGFFEHGTVALKPTTTELIACGDWAFRRYAYELTLTPKDEGDPIIVRGHGIHMFKRTEDGSWCVAKDI
jgi:ketosteroid isomerase-like protein